MKKIKHTRLLKKLGMLASTIAPIAVVATDDGTGGVSEHATQQQVRDLRAADVTTAPNKARDVQYDTQPVEADINSPQHNGFTFRFLSATKVDVNGNSTVTFTTGSSNSAVTFTKPLDFIVSGFQTRLQAADIELASLTSRDMDTQPKKVASRPVVTFGATPIEDDVTLPAKAGFAFAFVGATPVNDNGESSVEYSVTKDGVSGTNEKKITFTISDFQTKIEAADLELASLTSRDMDTQPKKVASRPVVTFGATPIEDDVTLPAKAGFAFAFVGATPVNDNGESSVEYSVTKDGVSGTNEKKITFTISDFQTKIEAADLELASLTSRDMDTQPKKVASRPVVTFGATPIEDDVTLPAKAGFAFAFVGATPVNDNGESSVEYSVTKDGVSGTNEKKITFTISDFQTKIEAADLELASLTSRDMDTQPKKVASRPVVIFGATPIEDDVTLPAKAGFAFAFVGATPVNDNGESSVEYSVTKDGVSGTNEKKITFTISDFQTKIEAADLELASLTSRDMDTQPKKVASRPVVTFGATPIEDDVTLPAKAGFAFAFVGATPVNDNGESSVEYSVTKDGVSGTNEKRITFEIGGFVSDLSIAANKFQDFSSTRNAKDLEEKLKIKNDDSGANDVKVEFVKIPSYVAPGLETGTSISKVVVKTPFDESTRQVVYTLTVSDGTDSEDKDVTITFAPDWVAEIEKIKDFVATDNITSAAAKLAQNNNDIKDAYNAISGYEAPQFASNVEIKKVIVKTALDANSRKVVYTVTLWDGTHTHSTTKDVIVTFAPDWDTALAKFVDFETTDNVESAIAILKADVNVDIKDEFEGITKPSSYTKPTFSEGVAISKVVVKTALDENTRQVVYSITLKNGDEDHTTTKDVTVTFTHTLAAEANKIKDFVSSDDLAKAASFLKSDSNKKTEFEGITDYVEPTFVTGISITKVVVETAYDSTPPPNENTRQVVFKVTLEENKGGEENPTVEKSVTVTFKPNFTLEKDKLTKNDDDTDKEFSSKKGTYSDLAKAKKDADVTKLFIDNGGLILPKFAPGVSIKLVTVKIAPDSNRDATYSVTLTDTRTDEGPFDVVVKFAENLDAGLNDLNDFTTTDDTKSEAAVLPESMADDKKDEFTGITGFTTPTFAEGVSISQVIVKTKLNSANRQVVYEVTLEEDNKDPSTPNQTKKKDIIVTFAPDLDVEGNKFSDFSTTNNDKSDAAVLDASDQDVQETFKAITGYTAPNLIEGVTIKSINVKNAINDKRQVVFTIKLGFGDNETEKDVTVTFAASPSQAEDTALTTSQIVGIGIGSALGVGVLGYLIYYLIKRRR